MKQNNPIDISQLNPAKLSWACRRGMLELDVLLGNFLNEAYPGLPDSDKALFVELLSCNDPEILNWIMAKETPEDAGLARITKMIGHHAKTRVHT